MPGTSCNRPAAAASRNSSAVWIPRAAPISRAPAGPESEKAAEGGELRGCLLAKLLHLGEASGLDELTEPRLDPRADPSQLADAADPDEVGDRQGAAAIRSPPRLKARAA